MPGPLPHPSPRRRNYRPPVRALVADGVVRGPELPDGGPDGSGWCAATRAWWQDWRTSPQSQLFTPVDWESLLVAAALHDRMWSEHRVGLAAEIRLWTSKFGATPKDRLRLHLAVEGGSP